MKPLSETARETTAKVSEVAQKTAENAKLTAEAAKARIQEGYGRARAATSDLAAKGAEQAGVAREVAGEALAKGKAQAKRANSKLKDVAEKQPIALVAGAVAIGALLGALLPKGGGTKEDLDRSRTACLPIGALLNRGQHLPSPVPKR